MVISRTRQVKPSDVRLSPHFLLSDFMGCDSVYRLGYSNVMPARDLAARVAEGEYLCNQILEPILHEYGPVSISYGYISPELSRKVVGYQDPDKPSYHRWDKGAAADVCVHYYIAYSPPVRLAHALDEALIPYSRMITYSESPYICVASQMSEGDKPRRAFYENRYVGVPRGRPLYIRKPAHGSKAMQEHVASLPALDDWRGAGYPTYHGGGRRQLHHIRCGDYSVVSDFLYDDSRVAQGGKAMPSPRERDEFALRGVMYSALLHTLDVPRVSIIGGYKDHAGTALICKPPEGTTVAELLDAAADSGLLVGSSSVPGGVRLVLGYAT